MGKKVIILIGHRIAADGVNRYRVRGGKPATKTDLKMLARAEEKWPKKPGSQPYLVKNERFGKYTNVLLPNKSEDGKKTTFNWHTTEHIKPVKMLTRMQTSGVITGDIGENINHLLRNILLFKGITFDQVDEDIKSNSNKPMTYLANVKVRIADITDDGTEAKTNEFHVHLITVKKVFKHDVKGQGKLAMRPQRPLKTKTSILQYDTATVIRHIAIINKQEPEIDLNQLWDITTEKSFFFDGKTCANVKKMWLAANSPIENIISL